MKKILLIYLIVNAFSCEIQAQTDNDIILNRLKFVYSLKPYISYTVWPNFDADIFDVPLIYYIEKNCFIVNPTNLFLEIYHPVFVDNEESFKVYESRLLDSIPFHMSVSVTFGDLSSDYNYKSPFMNCSGVEITQRYIPDVSSTEEWATMVIHEYFHGFQFKHKKFIDYYEKNIVFTSQKELLKLYKTNDWFKLSVDKENKILLSALGSKNKNETFKLIKQFFVLRDKRRNKTMQKLRIDIKNLEAVYETLEGTARYVEYSLYEEFSKRESDNTLKIDTLFHSYVFFRNFDLKAADWLYKTEKTNYFYATGFNLARILDKLKIEYKSKLFNKGGETLENILREKYSP